MRQVCAIVGGTKMSSTGTQLKTESPLLSVKEVARRLGVSVPTVRRRIRDGEIESYRVKGVKVSEEQLAEYLQRTLRQKMSERD